MRLRGKFKKHMKKATIFGLILLDALDNKTYFCELTNEILAERSGFSESSIEKSLLMLQVEEKIFRENEGFGKRKIIINCLQKE